MCGGLSLPFAGPKGDLRSTSYVPPSRHARACWIISTFKSKKERGRAFSDDVTANLMFLFSFHASILGPLMFKYRGSVYFEISYSCYWRRLHHRILINELLILVHDIIYISSAVSSEIFLACYCVLLSILLQPAQWPLWKLWITAKAHMPIFDFWFFFCLVFLVPDWGSNWSGQLFERKGEQRSGKWELHWSNPGIWKEAGWSWCPVSWDVTQAGCKPLKYGGILKCLVLNMYAFITVHCSNLNCWWSMVNCCILLCALRL